jgi:hypothetical protein
VEQGRWRRKTRESRLIREREEEGKEKKRWNIQQSVKAP